MIKHLLSVKLIGKHNVFLSSQRQIEKSDVFDYRQISSLEIACHPEATHFSCESGEIKFYRVNPRPGEKMVEIPKGTNVLEFPEYRPHRGWIDYGTIRFRSHRGNILKTENYTS